MIENPARDEAVELLTHYFEATGVLKHKDCHAEIGRCVDTIIEAAVDEAMRCPAMQQLLARRGK